ncbi:MAG TPA: MaoC/PaaZ C-terminal domain-containing protein [Solirubrobacteraceae bacterium]|jgi:3-hydroxybutyryl-CoA dehydratase|nr:MaoC/PaaZ C-terminal domain-containing protein [Solirubrobacteraceae bacterium]
MSDHARPASEPSVDGALQWSEPFDRLSVGQRFRSGQRAVRDTDVIVFSALTGDWHPQHSDPEWAARSPFGERIAHGMLTLSLAVGLLPLDPELVLALRRLGEVVFKRPVRLNETICVAGEIASLAPIDDRAGLVGFGLAIRNQDDALVCRARVEVLWRRDGADDGQGAGAYWHDAVVPGASNGEFVPVPL